MGLRRLPGRLNPLEFIITLPDDHIDVFGNDENGNGEDGTGAVAPEVVGVKNVSGSASV